MPDRPRPNPGPHVHCYCGTFRDRRGVCPHCDTAPDGQWCDRSDTCPKCMRITETCPLCKRGLGSRDAVRDHLHRCYEAKIADDRAARLDGG